MCTTPEGKKLFALVVSHCCDSLYQTPLQPGVTHLCSSVCNYVKIFLCTHIQSGQVIINCNFIFDCASNSADNAVNDVHNSIGCNLVAIDNPGTVHSHHLHITYTSMLWH